MAMGTTARDLMHAGCECIKHDEPVLEAAKRMADEDIGALPICGPEDKLVGMLTDRDIVVKCIAKGMDTRQCTAGELAEGHIVWVSEGDAVQDVLAKMEEHQIRRVPVIGSDKRLVGIISQGDIAKHLDEKETGELVEAVSRGPANN